MSSPKQRLSKAIYISKSGESSPKRKPTRLTKKGLCNSLSRQIDFFIWETLKGQTEAKPCKATQIVQNFKAISEEVAY
jgi:hypothetical protein